MKIKETYLIVDESEGGGLCAMYNQYLAAWLPCVTGDRALVAALYRQAKEAAPGHDLRVVHLSQADDVTAEFSA